MGLSAEAEGEQVEEGSFLLLSNRNEKPLLLERLKTPPPWRWPLWGPWPPHSEESPPASPEEQIRPIAERLSKQRPWLSAEENWLAAERALKQKPWRPWVIRFSGEKERSGWDWADLLLKVSVPVLILGLSTAYSILSSNRQQTLATDQRENEVLTGFIKEMKPLILDNNLKGSGADAEVRGVARGMTLAALTQLKSPERKGLAVRFLLDSGLNAKPGNLFNLSGADLSRADLSRAMWDDYTKWPNPERFADAKNIPQELKKKLGLP